MVFNLLFIREFVKINTRVKYNTLNERCRICANLLKINKITKFFFIISKTFGGNSVCNDKYCFAKMDFQ